MAVCVVGAGISGLATAVSIQKLAPTSKVTLIAENITPHTLSDIPAGLWRPYFLPDPRKNLIKKWGEATFREIDRLYKENAKEYGVDMVSGYEFYDKKPSEDYYWRDTVYGFHVLSPADIKRLGYSFKFGVQFTTFCLQPLKYLPHLLKQFKQNGGTVIKKKLGSLKQIGGDFDVIVNCTGLGSHSFVNDKTCHPVRGQVFRVEAPFAKLFYSFNGGDYYILPNQDTVVLGGTHQIGDWDTSVRKEDSEAIWRNLTTYLPCLKEARILVETVGLRPGRPEIRLEAEKLTLNGKDVAIVHNYGHGGSGITLYYGCAMDAAQLAVKHLNKNFISKL